jgi:predicted lipoprotein with Yx(FWY)xxD motif
MRTFSGRIVVFALIVAAAIPTAALAVSVDPMHPAVEAKSNIGKVIATPGKLGLYYWDVEKKAKGKLRCTDECLVEWPAVYVKGPVAKHVKGVMATFGTIKRGSKRQLTVNGLPAYTYKGDTAGIVKCDNVDGWHAVRPK